jgi:hydrogenase expression/formation protein HypE
VAILSRRQGLEFGTIESDSAALHRMVAQMVAQVPGIAVLRDPTRGGFRPRSTNWPRRRA